jgi:CHAT domain-containing protein
MELARLVGSSREIESCARVWRSHGYEPILLRGAAANRENLAGALGRNPAVLHVAAHILFPPQYSGPGLIALALQRDGEIELLSATEIAAMRLKLGLVVLNGCSSAHAPTLPGAGLMGMTRAWLAAGARAVIATRWAIGDERDGEIFQSFYDRLSSVPDSRHRGSSAQVLQQAQLTEVRAGGRRANPASWAAYFCVERN